jgi:hypothetical protein
VPFGRHRKDEWELLRAMRNPRIPPLASLRPDLPEPLLDAVARALEPEREHRTISATELAVVVRAHFDVGAGWTELASLLERWKGALERSVKRAQPVAEATLDSESSGQRSANTLRYEEVALAFDDDASPDGPTFEAHALPSEASLKAHPSVEAPGEPREEPRPSLVALPAAPSVRPRPGARNWSAPVLLLVGFALAVAAAALLASHVR